MNSSNNNHQQHLQQVHHRPLIAYGTLPVMSSHNGTPPTPMGIAMHVQHTPQGSQTAGNGSPPASMAPSIGFLGQPQTYGNFGVDSNGVPVQGLLALVLIPPGLNPSAAVAANCQIFVLGNAPPQRFPLSNASSLISPNGASFMNMSFNSQGQPMTPASSHSMHHHHQPTMIPPETYHFLNALPRIEEPLNTSTPGSGGSLNPNATVFIPSNSSMCSSSDGSSRERGGGDRDTHLEEDSSSGDHTGAVY